MPIYIFKYGCNGFDPFPNHKYFNTPVSLTESLANKHYILTFTLPVIKNINQITLNYKSEHFELDENVELMIKQTILFLKSYNDLTDAPVLFSKSYNDLTDTPTLFSKSYNDLTDAPVIFSKSYNDLTDTPTLFSKSYNDLTDAPVVFSKSYNDLTDAPTLFSKSYNDLTHTPNVLWNDSENDISYTLGDVNFFTNTNEKIPFDFGHNSLYVNGPIMLLDKDETNHKRIHGVVNP